MKMKPIFSTIVQNKKAILQEKTVMMTELCISGYIFLLLLTVINS